MDETKKQRKVSCYSKCVALINTPPCSKALSAEQRSTCCSTFIDDVSTLCVCLIVFFFVPPENFSLMETLQIFPSARHSWSLGSEGSFACHTYCDMGHRFIMVISEDPWHSHRLPSVLQWSCLFYLFFYDLSMLRLGCKHPNFRLQGENSNPLHHRCGFDRLKDRWCVIHFLCSM